MFKSKFPVLLLLLASLVSCQSQVSLHVSGNQNLNQDIQRRVPEPVSVQVYQLKSDQKFKEANFFQIVDNPEKTLGADYLPPVFSFMLSPNQKQDVSVKLNSDAKYFGIVAAFHAIDNAKWKAIIPLEGNSKKNITLILKDRNLIVQ
ncbi:MAG: type VI secretion system lipoprotein TssJ [Bdellovibrionota bacterium]